jgi:hypothetical protein
MLGRSANVNFGGLASTTSNWFNMSAMQSQDLSGKLRNFKKGNNATNKFNSTQHSPKGSKDDIIQITEEKQSKKEITFDEREQRLFAKLKNRAKAMLTTTNDSYKH